jgi:hypothetical protein
VDEAPRLASAGRGGAQRLTRRHHQAGAVSGGPFHVRCACSGAARAAFLGWSAVGCGFGAFGRKHHQGVGNNTHCRFGIAV